MKCADILIKSKNLLNFLQNSTNTQNFEIYKKKKNNI
jgi:hypothetical protein